MDPDNEAASLRRVFDRLVATPNDQLEKVLGVLLPKLIPMVNNDNLRDKLVLPMFSHILKRIKPLKTSLPIEKLLPLIKSDTLPFGCNFTIAFVDTAVEWHPREAHHECAVSLANVLDSCGFKPFTPQSNALCYYVLVFLESLSSVHFSNGSKELLGDLLIDISLVQPGLQKNVAGSVQAGLSSQRVDRLTSKKAEWSLSVLRSIKLALVESLPKAWLPTPCAVLVSIVLSCDPDPEVATQAVFKMNGARSMLPDIDQRPLRVLELLLYFCMPMCIAETAPAWLQPYLSMRTSLREDVKCMIVRWITKELPHHLETVLRLTTQLVYLEVVKPVAAAASAATASAVDMSVVNKMAVDQQFLSLVEANTRFVELIALRSGSPTTKYAASLMELAALLCERMMETLKVITPVAMKDAQQVQDDRAALPALFNHAAPLLLHCAKQVLQPFSSQLSAQASSSADSDLGITTREGCYRVIECLSRKFPDVAVKDSELLVLLFRLLDCEDERAAVKLYAALGALRMAYQGLHRRHDASTGDREEFPAGTSSLDLSASATQALRDLISRSRASAEPKKRLAAVQWSRALFGWSELTLETLLLLADDGNESVSKGVETEFIHLRGLLESSTKAKIDDVSTSGKSEHSPGPASAPTIAVEGVVTGGSDVSVEPSDEVIPNDTAMIVEEETEYSQFPDQYSTETAAAVLSQILGLISSPLLYTTNPFQRDSEKETVLKYRPVATESLLHCAAIGLRSRLRDTSGYEPDCYHFSGADSWPLMILSEPESGSRGSYDLNEELAVAIIHSIARLAQAEPLIISQLRSDQASSSKRLSKSAPAAASEASTAAKSRQAKAVVASASADVIRSCVLLVGRSDKVTSGLRDVSSSLLLWMSIAHDNGLDPLGLYSVGASPGGELSFRRSEATTAASAAVEVTPMGESKSVMTSQSNSTDIYKNVGSIRMTLSHILGACCAPSDTDHEADVNFVSNLLRVLGMKFQRGTVTDDAAAANDSQSLEAAGALSAVGSMAEVVHLCVGGAGGQRYPSAIQERLLSSVIQMIMAVIDRPLRPFTPGQGQLFCDLQVVALQTLSRLAARGMLKVSSNDSPDMSRSITDTLLKIVEGYMVDGSTPATPAASATASASETIGHNATSSAGHGAAASADQPSTASSHLRSSHVAQVTAAAVDALSRLCTAGELPPTDLFHLVWEKILELTTRLPREESPLLRFSVAQALVRMSSVPLVPFPQAHSQQMQATDGVSSGGDASSAPALVKVLLGIVATAAASARTAPPEGDSSGDTAQLLSVPPSKTTQRSTAAVVLLVLIKQLASMCASEKPQSNQLFILSYDEIMQCVEMLLEFLRDRDPFIQDVSCAGLCHLYNIARHIDGATTRDRGSLSKSLQEAIATEVIATLTREKRTYAPAGVAVAGESTSTSAAGDAARAIESLLERANNPDGGDDGNRGSGGGGGRGNGGGRGGAGRGGGGRGRGGGGGAVAGGGGGAQTQDHLATAVATAAAELGLSPEDVANAMGGRGQNRSSGGENNFGVYSTICKVAKKTGDTSVVFAVLALVRRDPAFGLAGSESYHLRVIYQPPVAAIDSRKTKKLLPMLYLAKHDPSQPVRELMKQLWNSLCTAAASREEHPQHLLIALQKEVISFLCSSLNNPQWRDREAACSALEAFLPLRHWSVVRRQFADLWISGMGVLDDLRESTRMAAVGLMKVLTEQVVRACNPDEAEGSLLTALHIVSPGVPGLPGNKSGQPAEYVPNEIVDDAIGMFLPLLLDHPRGVLSSAPECRGFVLGVLLRLIKVCRAALGEWLVKLVSVMVESMSALEPRTMQYMQFHTARLQISEEELENLRLKWSRQSPMQEALDACLQSFGGRPQDIPEVTRALCTQLQSGVGLATRAAAAQSLAYLAEKHPGELGASQYGVRAFQTVVGSLLNAPQMAMSLRKALISGMGTLAKVINAEVLAATCDQLVDRYEALGRDETSAAPIIAECLQQIISRAGDRILDDHTWLRLLACSYIGEFDTDTEAKDIWSKVWPEVLTGSGAGTKSAGLLRILDLLQERVCALLADLAWDRRKQGVAVLSDLSVSLTSAQLAPSLGIPILGLLRSIRAIGQIWSGQGLALETIALLASKCAGEGRLNTEASADVLLLARTERGEPAKNVLLLRDLLERKVAGNAESTEPTDSATSMDVEADAETKEILSSSSTPSQTVALNPTDQWELSTRGIIGLLLREATRGDREYRLSSARALAALPWQKICSAEGGRQVFTEYCREFISLSGIKDGLAAIARADVIGEESVASSAAREASAGAVTGGGSSRMPAATANASAAARAKVVSRSNAALFGSRYGIDFSKKPPPRIVSASAARPPASAPALSDNSQPQADAAVVSIDHELSSEEHRSSQEIDADVSAIATSHTPAAPTATAALGPDSAMMTNDALDSDGNDSSPHEETSGTSTASAAAASNTESSSSATASVSIATSLSTDPAYRVKFIECLSSGWSEALSVTVAGTIATDERKAGAEAVQEKDTQDVTNRINRTQIRSDLIRWATATIGADEVWSIRLAAFQLLGALVASNAPGITVAGSADASVLGSAGEVDEEEFALAASAVAAVARGLADAKYSKVRVGALACLHRMLTAQGCKSILQQRHRDEIRALLRVANGDSQPNVLEAAGKAQSAWLSVVDSATGERSA